MFCKRQQTETPMAWHPFSIFFYGTLKRDQPNYYLLGSGKYGKSEFVGKAATIVARPLVVDTPYNVPFLLDQPGQGHVC